METELSRALDECLYRITSGQAIEVCLGQYPRVSEQLESLLRIALSISAAPKVSPSDEFRKASKVRLMARLREESTRAEGAASGRTIAEPNALAVAWQRFGRLMARQRIVAIPIALALIVALVGGLFLSGALTSSSPPSAVAECTLTTTNGHVDIQVAGSPVWVQGYDGIPLDAGTRVRTTPGSQAFLTFAEGSTIKLEPGSELEILQVEHADSQRATIVLRQWSGITWSRVTAKTDQGSRYELQTPSAYATVRGTLFLTEVDDNGSTSVQTIEGVVAVGAQNQEVEVSAGYETKVEPGATPSQPTPVESPAIGFPLLPGVQIPVVEASGGYPITGAPGWVPGYFAPVQLPAMPTGGGGAADGSANADDDGGATDGGSGATDGDTGTTGDGTGDTGDGSGDTGDGTGDTPADTGNTADGDGGDTGDGSGDVGDGSGDTSDGTGDTGDGSGDTADASANTADAESGDTADGTANADGESGDSADGSGDAADGTANADGESGDSADGTANADGESGDSADATGDTGDATGDTGDATGDTGDATGDTGDTAGDGTGDTGDGTGDTGDATGE